MSNRATYLEKASCAIEKNFNQLKGFKAKTVKAKAIQLCYNLELEHLKKLITASKKDQLDMFFTAKTHKQGCPFRVIVTEKGSWQANVSQFLLRHLSTLRLNDPFLLSNSDDLVLYLQQNKAAVRYGFSLDVEDLFYSIPHTQLFSAVRESIEENGSITFQNQCGIHVDSFLELLKFYLSATAVSFNDTSYIQKKGICIGSCVAPVLCDIFLAKCDRDIANTIAGAHVTRIFRYVDDYLVLLRERPVDNEIQTLCHIRSSFLEQAEGLKFTYESPENDTLQFLDIRLTFMDDHTCWVYSPRSKKRLLPYDSAHSKLIKRAIVTNCFTTALKKSCHHSAMKSFENQVQRLLCSGFPSSILFEIAEKLLTSKRRQRQREKSKRPAILPYLHRLSHNIKKVASKYDVQIVLSAPDKLKKLCPKINNTKGEQGGCQVNHRHKYVECNSRVVYEIPLSCGQVYIGQSGRCINVRLREHDLALKASPAGHLAVHVRDCNCTPLFKNTKILKRLNEKTSREICEAHMITRKAGQCISAPSVALSKREIQYLELFH